MRKRLPYCDLGFVLDRTIDGLVMRDGLGYLKFDYNIDAGIGIRSAAGPS